MEKNPEQSHESVAAPTSPQGSTRRHFLKGTTLALPVVVTLHSGAALAATSLGCGDFNGNTQNYASVLVPTNNPPSDNRFRVPVELYKKLKLQSDPSNVPSNWQVVTNDPGCYFKGNNVWRLVTTGAEVLGDELAAVVAAAFIADTGGNSNNMKTGTINYAIAHVSTSSGAIVAVGSPVGSTLSNAIVTSWTGACLTSLYKIRLV